MLLIKRRDKAGFPVVIIIITIIAAMIIIIIRRIIIIAMMADSSNPKITGESVLCGCGKLSGGCTGRSSICMDWNNLDRGKPGHWLRMFEWLTLFVACAFPGQLILFPPQSSEWLFW